MKHENKTAQTSRLISSAGSDTKFQELKKYVVLIACPDRPGLVHQITGVMFNQKLNVTENQEFVDHHTQRFFMRTQFEAIAEGMVDCETLAEALKNLIPDAFICQVRELGIRNLVIFASRELHCLGDLLVRHSTGELRANILAVISQHPDCGPLVERFELPFICIPVAGDRKSHEAEILRAIEPLAPDYLVLARYMRIFSQDFVSHYPERMINIHHSFLPAFIGKDPYQQAHERGVKIIGATAHFVIEGLDQGPIITQGTVPVDHSDSPSAMARRGQDVEKIILSQGLNLVLADRVMIENNRTIVFGRS